jgi:hypothetical protein
MPRCDGRNGSGPCLGDEAAVHDREQRARGWIEQHDGRQVSRQCLTRVVMKDGDQLGAHRCRCVETRRHGSEESTRCFYHRSHGLFHLTG